MPSGRWGPTDGDLVKHADREDSPDVTTWSDPRLGTGPHFQTVRALRIAGVRRCATCQKINSARMPARARCSEVKHCGHPGERQVAGVLRFIGWHPRALQLDRPDRDMCHNLTVDAFPEDQRAQALRIAGVRLGATWS